MLQSGDAVVLYSVVFGLVLLGTRSPVWSCGLAISVYLFLAVFKFPQVPDSRARQVLSRGTGVASGLGRASSIAHRGGGHDAPENTIAAIRQLTGTLQAKTAFGLCSVFHNILDVSLCMVNAYVVVGRPSTQPGISGTHFTRRTLPGRGFGKALVDVL
ncbi:hypothetical protein NHX12_018297 [Muraenolepis orangiensis]|uniref:Uncharacterized protein n=1 Tax=Muraenolepis orangiensis TaxID=630683 RepID=A0A9Q0IYR4_9TELE|nr:hypothetical protein NHX12_018297 [Muraenolepis orangiensis]